MKQFPSSFNSIRCLVVCSVVLFVSCSKNSNPVTTIEPLPTSVSGLIVVPDSLKASPVVVAFFYGGAFGTFPGRNDKIYGSFAIGPELTIISKQVLLGNTTQRSFEISLPTGRDSVWWLLAWSDTNPDGQPNFGSEQARFPLKFVFPSPVVLTSWQFLSSQEDYSIRLSTGSTNTLRSLGGTGFQFSFN